MFKVLLVDDEKLVLESLVDYIDWESMDISIVGTAKNGRDALIKVQELKPNIVLTDIKMPIMNGIEFSKRAMEYDSNLKIVFLSGHDEFQYAKSAISLGAFGYILKPIEEDELREVMEKVKLKCNLDNYSSMTTESLKQKYFKQLLVEESVDEVDKLVNEIVAFSGKEGYIFESKFYLAVVSIDNYAMVAKESSYDIIENITNSVSTDINNWLGAGSEPFYVINLTNGQFCIIICENHTLAINFEAEWKVIRDNIQKSRSISLSIGMCDNKGSVDNICELYLLANKAINEKFYYGKSQIIISSQLKKLPIINTTPLKEIEKELVDTIYIGNKENVYTNVNKYFEFLCSQKVERDLINVSIYNLLNSVYEYFMKHDKDHYTVLNEKSSILENILAYDNIVSIKEYFIDMLDSIMNYFQEGSENNRVINKIISILRRDYSKIITADDLAKEIFLTPNYIRTIFKKYTGETILEYHTKVRMEKAAELIANRSQKIYDVSKLVGYENTSYFCALFSKYFGMTPNEYRKKII
ncbi:MAG TPA: response regulator [Ruminiclostridium sp.]